MADTVTAPAVRAAKGTRKLTMITAYDTPTARIADRAGADIILTYWAKDVAGWLQKSE